VEGGRSAGVSGLARPGERQPSLKGGWEQTVAESGGRAVSYFFLLSGPEEVRELAALELWALSGVEAEGVCGVGQVAADVIGAAYTRFCAETIAAGADLEELVAATEAAGVELEGFNIHVWQPAPRAPERPMAAIVRLADAIEGRPDLSHPRVELAVVAQAGHWRLGRVVSAASRDWRQWKPPVDFSAALPPQIARAMLNLVAAPGDTLLDPCCGVGTVVAQAAQRGVRAVGVEISKKLAGRAAECVYGARPGVLIVAGDGREIGGRFDAAVVDLPYGRSSLITQGLYGDLLGNLSGLVQRAAVVAAEPIGQVLEQAGFGQVRMARVRSNQLTRYVHLVGRPTPAS